MARAVGESSRYAAMASVLACTLACVWITPRGSPVLPDV